MTGRANGAYRNRARREPIGSRVLSACCTEGPTLPYRAALPGTRRRLSACARACNAASCASRDLGTHMNQAGSSGTVEARRGGCLMRKLSAIAVVASGPTAWSGVAARRVAVLGRRRRQQPLLHASPTSRRQRQPARACVGVEHGRNAERRVRYAPRRVRGHTDHDRQRAVPQHAVQARRRARRRDRASSCGPSTRRLERRRGQHRVQASRHRLLARRRRACAFS